LFEPEQMLIPARFKLSDPILEFVNRIKDDAPAGFTLPSGGLHQTNMPDSAALFMSNETGALQHPKMFVNGGQ